MGYYSISLRWEKLWENFISISVSKRSFNVKPIKVMWQLHDVNFHNYTYFITWLDLILTLISLEDRLLLRPTTCLEPYFIILATKRLVIRWISVKIKRYCFGCNLIIKFCFLFMKLNEIYESIFLLKSSCICVLSI